MKRSHTTELDYIEILPAASPALKEKVEKLVSSSTNLNAVIASLDRETGTYEIILQGTLAQHMHVHQNAA